MITAALLLCLASATVAYAAPSGKLTFETGDSSEDNQITVGSTDTVEVTFNNTASKGLDDVASTIQYITLTAANLNPSRATINVNAWWRIVPHGQTAARATGTATGVASTELYAPYSTADPVEVVTWSLGAPNATLAGYTDPTQFNDDLLVLRPRETLTLNVTVLCLGLVGDTRVWFFYRATEHQPPAVPVTSLSSIPPAQRNNLYYSKAPGAQTPYWWPLHNSYDPYDEDLGTGHNYGQYSWARGATDRAFAKANKDVHQTPGVDPVEELSVIHICGYKFTDGNGNGVMDPHEKGADGVNVALLGPDAETPAEEWYSGSLVIQAPDTNPMQTGENMLRGAYCFNLVNVTPGSYTFHVRAEEPPGAHNTTSFTLGPITVQAGPGETVTVPGNDFGNRRLTVGGTLSPDTSNYIGYAAAAAAFAAAAALSSRRSMRAPVKSTFFRADG